MRAAAAQAIEATAGQAGFTRERAQELADELVSAAGRLRETLEDLRPAGADELVALRERVEALEARVREARGGPHHHAPAHHAGQASAGQAAGQPAAGQPAAGFLDLSAGVAWPAGASSSPAWRTRSAARLAQRRSRRPGVERVVGVDTRGRSMPASPSGSTSSGRPAQRPTSRRSCAPRRSTRCVHNDIVQFPEPGRSARDCCTTSTSSGRCSCWRPCDGAADAARRSSCAARRRSTAREPSAPAFFTEEMARPFPAAHALPARRRRARAAGRRVRAPPPRASTCTMLRLQPIVGARPRHADQCAAPLAGRPDLARLRPAGAGRSHDDDAVGAMAAAVRRPVRGAVNVAADGAVSLSRVLRRRGRPALPVAGAAVGPLLGAARARLGAARCPTRSRATCATAAASTPRACARSWASAQPIDDRGDRGARRRCRREAPADPCAVGGPARGRLGLSTRTSRAPWRRGWTSSTRAGGASRRRSGAPARPRARR